MRVLIAANPEKSTFLYLVPFAWALRTAGHEVRVASQPRFAAVITQAGLTAVPVGWDVDKWAGVAPEVLEAARAGLPEPWNIVTAPDKVDWESTLKAHIEAVEQIHQPDNFPMIDGLVRYAQHWKPHLIIWEPLCYAGPIAAKATGATHARILFGIDVFGLTRQLFLHHKNQQPPHNQTDPLANWLNTYGHKYNYTFTEDMTTGHFTIDQLPPSLQEHATNLHYLPMQHIPYGGPAAIPHWLRTPPPKPRVALTLGLTATEIFNGYNIPLPDIITTLATLDIELIATIATTEQHKLTHIPNNTRITPYTPWHTLAPTCTAVIHHAGAATLTTTARWPIPQLSLHHHFDQPILARKLTTQGTGLDLPTTHATPTAIHHKLHQLLTNPTHQQHAQQLTNEIHNTPTPNHTIPHIEQLTTHHNNH
ncbi:nucleotide disphospho-sugar-binding domain-containing protein [Amycolatopsis lurida]